MIDSQMTKRTITIVGVSTPPLTPLATAVLRVGVPERILEVECGDGEATLFLSREFPRASVRGVDSSEESVRAARRRVGLDPEGRVAFKVAKPRALPFPDDNFDLVVLVDAGPAVAETARVLRPGGRLILAETRRSGSADGPAARLLRWRLRRHRLVPEESAEVGDGSFSVARLRAAGPATVSI
jgi:ubiquinone/menaquinone biosynthesis C-methylase UbiE